jgi:hypothetical protein
LFDRRHLQSNERLCRVTNHVALYFQSSSLYLDVVEPLEIIAPFLTLLRAPYLSGPFKLVALDAVRTFTCSNILSELPERTGEALASVVDAVTRCKFVQTDAFGDDLVQLQIILTLDDVIRSPIRCYLTDTTTLDIIRSCHSVLLHTALTGAYPVLTCVCKCVTLTMFRFWICSPHVTNP